MKSVQRDCILVIADTREVLVDNHVAAMANARVLVGHCTSINMSEGIEAAL